MCHLPLSIVFVHFSHLSSHHFSILQQALMIYNTLLSRLSLLTCKDCLNFLFMSVTTKCCWMIHVFCTKRPLKSAFAVALSFRHTHTHTHSQWSSHFSLSVFVLQIGHGLFHGYHLHTYMPEAQHHMNDMAMFLRHGSSSSLQAH